MAVAAALLGVSLTGGSVLLAGQTSQPADLVETLVGIEDELNGIALMPTVGFEDGETWGTVRGDFVGARLRIDRTLPELLHLVERAGDIDTPTADAVGAVASAWRVLHEAYVHLERYEAATLALAFDEEGIFVEEARGHAEVGLELALTALERFHDGYAVLRDVDDAADFRAHFELRFAEVLATARQDGHDARALLDKKAAEVLMPTQRFDTRGGAHPARSVRYVCVNRDEYHAAVSDGTELPAPTSGDDLRFADCPELPADAP